jgi:hypothetical protein
MNKTENEQIKKLTSKIDYNSNMIDQENKRIEKAGNDK